MGTFETNNCEDIVKVEEYNSIGSNGMPEEEFFQDEYHLMGTNKFDEYGRMKKLMRNTTTNIMEEEGNFN